MKKLTLQVSIIDCEPVAEIVDIICSYPKEQLPDDLVMQIEAWVDKHTTDED